MHNYHDDTTISLVHTRIVVVVHYTSGEMLLFHKKGEAFNIDFTLTYTNKA